MNEHEQQIVNEICRRYENEHGDGDVPAISVFLDKIADDVVRIKLLDRLVRLSIDRRSSAAKLVTPEDYQELGHKAVGIAYLVLAESSDNQTFVGESTFVGGSEDVTPDMTSNAAVDPTSLGSVNGDEKQFETDDGERQIRPGTTIGKYKLLNLIGEGGMGFVWKAQQERPVRREVALKVIRSDLGSRKAVARFEAERQALAMMDHPNIARVFDAGTTVDGSPYFVMELVDGVPITKYCDDNNLSVKQRLDLLVPVCNAIQHAHQKGIIHRDLKPSNVLVPEFDGRPQPKVIDFGLAKALEQKSLLHDKPDMTKMGQVVGTLRYMSPEQAGLDDADVDTRTDVYSIGVIMYELLTGSTPLDKSSMQQAAMLELLNQIKEMEPPRPSTRLSDSHDISGISKQRSIEPTQLKRILRGDLDWIVMKALDKDRNRRYQSVSGMADDLKRFVNDDEVLARPPTATYRLQKFIARNRGLVASALALATLLIGGVVTSTWFAVEANRAKQAFAIKADSERQQRALADQKTKEAVESRELAVANEKHALAAEQIATDQRELAIEAQNKLARQLHLSELRQYAASLQQSLLAHRSGAFKLSGELLDNVNPEFQQWEFYYLKQKMQRMIPFHLDTFLNFDEGLYSVNVAFDDQYVYLAAGDLLKIDLETGKQETYLAGNDDNVCTLDISVDGKWLTVTTLYECTVYELVTKKKQLTIERNFNWVVEGVAQHIDVANDVGGEQATFLKIKHLCPTVIEDQYLIIPNPKKLEIVDIFDNTIETQQLPIASGSVGGFGYDASAKELFAWYDSQLRFINLETAKHVRSFTAESPIQHAAMLQGRDDVLLAVRDRLVVASKHDGKITSSIPTPEIVDINWAVEDPDILFLAGLAEGEVVAWDFSKGALARDRKIRIMSGGGFSSFAVSPNGQHCVYSDADSWVVKKLDKDKPAKIAVAGLTFAEPYKKNKFIVIQGMGKTQSEVGLFDVSSRNLELVEKIDGEVLSAAFDPESSVISLVMKPKTSSANSLVRSFNVLTKQRIRRSFNVDDNSILANRGHLVLDPTKSLSLKDSATGKAIFDLPVIESPDPPMVDPDLAELDELFGDFEDNVVGQSPSAVWMDRKLNLVFYAYTIKDSENGTRERNSTLVCYDIVNESLKYSVNAHLGITTGLQLDESGKRLFSCGSDGTIKIWDADSGIELLTVPTDFSSVDHIVLDKRLGTIWYSGRNGIGRIDAPSSATMDATLADIANHNESVGESQLANDPIANPPRSEFLLSASPYQEFATFKLRSMPVAEAIETAADWTGISIHAPSAFFEDVKRTKLWGNVNTLDAFMSRITRRNSWSYVYLNDGDEILAIVAPAELVDKVGRKNISKSDKQAFELLRPWLPVSKNSEPHLNN